MSAFRNALQDYQLSNLGYEGTRYTWQKGRTPSTNIRERLDRGVANAAWWDLFSNYSVSHLTHSFSDHCPILVNTTTSVPRSNSSHMFRFDVNWILEDDIENLIRST
ncbi:hypothetical protein like AT1G43760 [Hibiscus trionum]|uniref:Endonuclease/exonuclease/phosphatase domain-containing protein n=1 Tax=Hibiscus trionum TaxID=183268 RepID=A0A9W7GWB2_HIBTR|nr:hypothetical protein like AT1G43760 [Hibiscus trionum]